MGHLGVLQKRPNFLLVDKKPLIFIIYSFSNIIWVFQVYLSSERYTGKMCGLFTRLLKHFKWEVIRNQNLGLDGGWGRKVDLKDIWKVNLIDLGGCCWIVWHACKEREKSRWRPCFFIQSHWSVTPLVLRENRKTEQAWREAEGKLHLWHSQAEPSLGEEHECGGKDAEMNEVQSWP